MTINWKALEKDAGITLEKKYEEEGSLMRTGYFFGPFDGVQYISCNGVKAELKRRNYPLGHHGGCRSRLNWIKIAKCFGYDSEIEMLNDLYLENELSYFRLIDIVNFFSGENITSGALYYRFKKLGIRARPKGGANNIKRRNHEIHRRDRI
jgi:hypothetical protein